MRPRRIKENQREKKILLRKIAQKIWRKFLPTDRPSVADNVESQQADGFLFCFNYSFIVSIIRNCFLRLEAYILLAEDPQSRLMNTATVLVVASATAWSK